MYSPFDSKLKTGTNYCFPSMGHYAQRYGARGENADFSSCGVYKECWAPSVSLFLVPSYFLQAYQFIIRWQITD